MLWGTIIAYGPTMTLPMENGSSANMTCWIGQSEMEEKEYQITFNQIYLSKPTITEADGETSVLFPMAARLRNLT